MLEPMYPPPLPLPTSVSLLTSAMHALGTLRIVLGLLGFDQARAALLDGLRLISTSR